MDKKIPNPKETKSPVAGSKNDPIKYEKKPIPPPKPPPKG